MPSRIDILLEANQESLNEKKKRHNTMDQEPFPPRDIRKNPRSMYARVPQAMA